MKRSNTKFTRKKEEAILALLSQRNIEGAARKVDVAPQTLLRWMKIPEFDKAYREARQKASSQTAARLQQASSAAVTTLVRVMIDPDAPASAKVRAADCVLLHAAKTLEFDDMGVRVAELERAAEESKQEAKRRSRQ